MATAEQIKYEKIDDDVFNELFDLIMSKKKPTADVCKDPEIVAFLQAKNLPNNIDFNNIPLKSLKFCNLFLIKKTT